MPRKTIHGIDPYAPGGIEALLAHHRATFGDAVMEDDADAADAGAGAGADASADADTTDAGAADAGAGDAKDAAADKGGNLWDDPAKAKAEIERLRAENGKDRTTAKTKAAEDARNELTQSIGKALGLIKDGDDKPDPAKLTQTITDQATENKSLKVELAVYKAATTQGAKADALLDSRSFLAKLTGIDPTDAKAINKAIEDAVKENPSFKTVQAAGKSGADFTGGTGEGAKTPTTLEDAIANKMMANR